MVKDIERELALLLIENVEKKGWKLTYKDTATELSKKLNRNINPHFGLRDPLEVVARVCGELKLPIITVRVVRNSNNGKMIAGEGFYKIACELKPEYKTWAEDDAWRNENKLALACTEWDKLRAYVTGVSVEKSPKPIVAATSPDPFASWLTRTTKLAGSSVDKYARAVRTISQEMIDRNIIAKPITAMDAFELDIAMAAIMHNDYFIDKNKRGNHMYSNALKQFRYYRGADDSKQDSGTEYINAIANDIRISETERTAIVQSRIGQGQFRHQLMEKYHGSCVMTGINHPKLLVASHIKPWAASSNQERLLVDNGLLLSATYDRLFDSGLITFDKSGRVYISSFIGSENEKKLHLQQGIQYPLLVTNQMQQFLEYHNDVVFVK